MFTLYMRILTDAINTCHIAIPVNYKLRCLEKAWATTHNIQDNEKRCNEKQEPQNQKIHFR